MDITVFIRSQKVYLMPPKTEQSTEYKEEKVEENTVIQKMLQN